MNRVVPLGDQGALAYFEREEEALRFAAAARATAPGWLVDVVQAYASVAVFFDPGLVRFAQVAQELRSFQVAGSRGAAPVPGKLHDIPCCYEFQLDLDRIAEHTKLTPGQVIALHTGQEYTVYAIGFCPGFSYLGYLHAALYGVPGLAT